MNTIENLTERLKKEKYLTCSDFSLHREYIFLDENNIIKFMEIRSVIMGFDIERFKHSTFIPVERVFENFDYLN